MMARDTEYTPKDYGKHMKKIDGLSVDFLLLSDTKMGHGRNMSMTAWDASYRSIWMAPCRSAVLMMPWVT